MSLKEKVMSLVSRRSATDLRSELDRAQRELDAAEAAFAAASSDPGDKLWCSVEQARNKREQLGVKVRVAEEAELAQAAATEKAERERKQREMEDALAASTISAVTEAVTPLADRAARICAELLQVERERSAIVSNAIETAARAQALARELGDTAAETRAERATEKMVSFDAQTLAAITSAVAEAHSGVAASRAARLVDPLWRAE